MAEQAEFDPIRLSKLLAFLLRHRPDSVGIRLDPEGWVGLEALVEAVNRRRRLPYPLGREMVERLVMGEGSGRFELRDGKLRARAGHSVAGVDAAAPPSADLPEFLYLTVPTDWLQRAVESNWLAASPGEQLRLSREEPRELGANESLVVVEAGRASRGGVVFQPGEDGDEHLAASLPLRYLLSLRRGYFRQISAGGVLARGWGDETQFALMRTLPRGEVADPDPDPDPDPDVPEFTDPRQASDRRSDDRRRHDLPPPTGVERRQEPRRRERRRRRSGRWGPDGRLELPKGKLEAGETPEQAAVREVREELGIEDPLEVVATLQENHYVFRTPEGNPVFKTVTYFLLRCACQDPVFRPQGAEGIVGVEWWPGQRAIQQVAFPNLQPVLRRAWELSQTPPG